MLGAIDSLLTARVQLHIQTVVIRLGRVPFMDATGTQTLSEIIERYQRRPHPRDPVRHSAAAARDTRACGDPSARRPDNICTNLIEVSRRIGGTVREGARTLA